jgi:hypothetical protein
MVKCEIHPKYDANCRTCRFVRLKLQAIEAIRRADKAAREYSKTCWFDTDVIGPYDPE